MGMQRFKQEWHVLNLCSFCPYWWFIFSQWKVVQKCLLRSLTWPLVDLVFLHMNLYLESTISTCWRCLCLLGSLLLCSYIDRNETFKNTKISLCADNAIKFRTRNFNWTSSRKNILISLPLQTKTLPTVLTSLLHEWSQKPSLLEKQGIGNILEIRKQCQRLNFSIA